MSLGFNVRVDEIITLLAVLFSITLAVVFIRVYGTKSVRTHQALTRLIILNTIFDALAITIWAVFPAVQWSIYRLGFTIVGTEAAIAAAAFAATLFGLHKKQKWAPFLAIAITSAQRAFATYVFFPSPAIAITLAWSLIIIYFAYKDTKIPNQNP